MGNKPWYGDWHLLYELSNSGGPYPSPPAPGAKAVPFGFEVPKHPWPEWLDGNYKVLSNPAYRSSYDSSSASGSIGIYSFEIRVVLKDGVSEEAAVERLYASGCDDALFAVCDGGVRLDFDREADSLSEALDSACADIMKSGVALMCGSKKIR